MEVELHDREREGERERYTGFIFALLEAPWR